MAFLDHLLIGLYFLGVLGVGVFFLFRQERAEEYLVGDRRMGAGHLGLSVVATDVGGGFSIGLGGLGFTLGLAGGWMLFTGLLGAWLSAVLLIPRIKPLADRHGWRSFPDYLRHRYDSRVARLAGGISAVGYTGFTGAQILAGAKLAESAFGLPLVPAAIGMAVIVLGYTAMGGLQAVVYTNTVQWIVLFAGLLLFAVPAAWQEVGGWSGLADQVPAGHLDPFALDAGLLVAWLLTILPIWFVGMTLYQRIYAARDTRTAKRAWFLAGLLEFPLIAGLGVFLGVCGRALFPEADPEAALPRLLATALPVGVTGVVVAAFFSAVMSTADSCLLAAAGHVAHDFLPGRGERETLRRSRVATLVLGAAAVSVAFLAPSVLDAILGAYAVIVAGLFVPTLGGLLLRSAPASAALASAVVGGGAATILQLFPAWSPAEDPILVALPASLVAFLALTVARPRARAG